MFGDNVDMFRACINMYMYKDPMKYTIAVFPCAGVLSSYDLDQVSLSVEIACLRRLISPTYHSAVGIALSLPSSKFRDFLSVTVPLLGHTYVLF
jgi:hypothetical protein